MSTDEPSSSTTSLRLKRTRGLSVRTFMPGSATREQAGTSTRAPSTSTTQMRHAFTGVRFSAQHSVGVSTPAAWQALRSVAPSGTVTDAPSTLSSTVGWVTVWPPDAV